MAYRSNSHWWRRIQNVCIYYWLTILQYNIEQDRQCTYNATWDLFMQPLLQWKSNEYYIFWVCVCALSYPVSVRAPCCHLWPAGPSSIFAHFLINGTIFKQKLLPLKYVFWFSVQHLSETFFIPREFIKISKKYVGLRVKHQLFLSYFKELNFLDRFSKNRKISDFLIIVQWESSHSFGQTNRHDKANSCFLQFCVCA